MSAGGSEEERSEETGGFVQTFLRENKPIAKDLLKQIEAKLVE